MRQAHFLSFPIHFFFYHDTWEIVPSSLYNKILKDTPKVMHVRNKKVDIISRIYQHTIIKCFCLEKQGLIVYPWLA